MNIANYRLLPENVILKIPFYCFIPFSCSSFKGNQLCFSLENDALFLHTFFIQYIEHVVSWVCMIRHYSVAVNMQRKKGRLFLAPWNIFGIYSRTIQKFQWKTNYLLQMSSLITLSLILHRCKWFNYDPLIIHNAYRQKEILN